MGKPRRQVVYVDNARTQTAADITELGHCDALLQRFARSIEELKADGADADDAPLHLKQSLFYKNLGLRELKKRRQQLLA